MHSFRNDYSELAHISVLKALENAYDEQNLPYGDDIHSLNAKKLISERFNLKDASIFFISGGTQANLLVISYFLKNYEGVLACDTGHINVHETAAIEGSGHKVYTIKNHDGKLTSKDIINALSINNSKHMVKIKMVYISNSTEIGSIYTKKELADIYRTCKENNLLLYIDGARLACALTSKDNDIEIENYASLCDVFYIGGTKNGLISGEAIVINNSSLALDFEYHIKNKGAMLAKGFGLGIQFEQIFKENLYFTLGNIANQMAYYLADNLTKLGIKLANVSPTNQQFIQVSKQLANKLIDKFDLELWEETDNYSIIRIVTSWKTTIENCNELLETIKELS